MLGEGLEADPIFCVHCFSSPEELPQDLRPTRRGTCPWCGSRNQKLYPMHTIADQFRGLADLYPTASDFEDGPNNNLFRQIQHEWYLFDDRFSSSTRFPDFIDALLRDGLDNDEANGMRGACELVKPIKPILLEYFQEQFGESLFRGNFWERFLQPSGPPVSWYDAFLEDMTTEIPQNQELYRARVWDRNIEEVRFTRDKMGAPPVESISPGRTNRKCQRTLYCGGDVETCIAEARSYKGAGIAVSQIKLSRDVKIIDFASEIPIEFPLRQENIKWRIETKKLLDHIAYLFSLPANPSASELYYAPTQALCDFLRASGFDGIQYRSSLNTCGINYAFFKPEIGVPEDPEYHWIEDITVHYSDAEPFDTEHPYAYVYRRSCP